MLEHFNCVFVFSWTEAKAEPNGSLHTELRTREEAGFVMKCSQACPTCMVGMWMGSIHQGESLGLPEPTLPPATCYLGVAEFGSSFFLMDIPISSKPLDRVMRNWHFSRSKSYDVAAEIKIGVKSATSWLKPIFTLSESLVSFSIKWGNAIAFWLVMMVTKMCMKYVAYIVSDKVIVIAVIIIMPTMSTDKLVYAWVDNGSITLLIRSLMKIILCRVF